MVCKHGRQCNKCGGSSICEHGRERNKCKECGGSSICEHGRQRSRCKECGGTSICEHGRRRNQCKECGGASICPHGRIRSVCKECGGSSICAHGRIRSTCKECGGSSICEHGRERRRCKECGGSNICEHGRVRSVCKECGGSSLCEHGRVRSVCKECGGSGICEHGRQRSQCKECGGSFCEHGRRRNRCKECGGSCICEHGRERNKCKECGGRHICEHGRVRSRCKECATNLFCGRVGCKDGREFNVLEATMVNGGMKYKVEYVGGGAAYFGKRQLLSMIQQPTVPQIQQPAESIVKVGNMCQGGSIPSVTCEKIGTTQPTEQMQPVTVTNSGTPVSALASVSGNVAQSASIHVAATSAMRSALQQQDPPKPYEEPSRAAAHVDSAVAVDVAGGSACCVAEGESRLNRFKRKLKVFQDPTTLASELEPALEPRDQPTYHDAD